MTKGIGSLLSWCSSTRCRGITRDAATRLMTVKSCHDIGSPHERETILGVGGVVVADHHDEPEPRDGEQGQEPLEPGAARSDIVLTYGAEGTAVGAARWEGVSQRLTLLQATAWCAGPHTTGR